MPKGKTSRPAKRRTLVTKLMGRPNTPFHRSSLNSRVRLNNSVPLRSSGKAKRGGAGSGRTSKISPRTKRK